MNINDEYSSEFDKLRKSRVEVSFYKYGAARDNFGSGRVDAIGSLEVSALVIGSTRRRLHDDR